MPEFFLTARNALFTYSPLGAVDLSIQVVLGVIALQAPNAPTRCAVVLREGFALRCPTESFFGLMAIARGNAAVRCVGPCEAARACKTVDKPPHHRSVLLKCFLRTPEADTSIALVRAMTSSATTVSPLAVTARRRAVHQA